MVSIEVTVQHRRTRGPYKTVVVTIPKAIRDEAPWLEKAKKARIDTDGERIWIEPVRSKR